MALYTITKGATSSTTDLNQLVNLLNGTTTDTQVTVANRITAQFTGATAASGYVGGAPLSSSTTYATGDFITDPADGLIWACYSGGVALGKWASAGTGAWCARWHQASSQSLNVASHTLITLDTQDFDTQGLWSSANNGYVSPFAGAYRVVGRVSAGSNTTGYRIVSTIYVNGVEAVPGHDGQTGSSYYGGGPVIADLYLQLGDLVQLYAYTDSAASSPGTETLNGARTYLAFSKLHWGIGF